MTPLILCCSAILAATPVDFDRDVRPILSEHCFQCHGPDAQRREGKLRLDVREGLFASRDGHAVVAAGQPEASHLWRRITASGDERMPPPDQPGARPLSSEQRATIERWIREGAVWQDHWAFQTPSRPPLPAPASAARASNPIDLFVLSELERRGWEGSAEADRETLIRRVTLDLTGLPPTPEEVDAFLADAREDAYQRLVDRLLASPAYGERMTLAWLDAARYADTSGYQNDGPRTMWRWRDWVISACNGSMPYDQFTIEQLAGDLLPAPRLDQRIATGFNRNHRGNAEGGIIPEEYEVEYVVDRVDTTFTVWLGLTVGCARCHDHKYDPVTHREFYQLYAFFNSIPEHGRAIKEGNSPPRILAPTELQRERLETLQREVRLARARLDSLQGPIARQQRSWELALAGQPAQQWQVAGPVAAALAFDDEEFTAEEPAAEEPAAENPAAEEPAAERPAAEKPTAEKPAAERPAWILRGGRRCEGVRDAAWQFDGQAAATAADAAAGNFTYFDKFSISVWVRPDDLKRGVVVSRMVDAADDAGYYLQLSDGRLQFNLVKRWLDDSIRIETKAPLVAGTWQHVAATYDGSRQARGAAIYIDGRRADVEVRLDYLNQSFDVEAPLRVGGGGGAAGRFRGALDEVAVLPRVLRGDEIAALAAPESLTELAGRPVEDRTAPQLAKLRLAYLTRDGDPLHRQAFAAWIDAQRRRREYRESLPTTMVMEELPTPRDTYVLLRGQYDRPGEQVTRDTPSCLPPFPEGAPRDRLGLARWLFDPAHPLTARVAVNRCWQMFFGVGLVASIEDFGTQGQRPSHPQLLDFLATELIRHDWDLKAIQRLIVTSATYRQRSQWRDDLRAADPDNRWLARGPRVRLPAGVIRDQVLAASGLLSRRIGGPSVRPYQPEGLWKDIATVTEYQQDHGEGLYRRSMYTYWKRTVAPPSMLALDASPREMCVVRQSRTNTPLQALTLLNETAFVEASRVLAERVLHERQAPGEQLERLFRLATGRRPRAAERAVLERSLRRHLEHYRSRPAEAEQLLQGSGERPRDPSLPAAELAAMTMVANTVFNLDEVITKQ